MAYYDIGEVFQAIEEEMIASMSRNLKRHLQTELDEGINYAMWQAEQLAALNEFKRNNKHLFGNYFSTINGKIEEILRKAHETGKMDQEVQILDAIRKGWSTPLKSSGSIQGAFFRINDRKLKALINSVTKDMKRAETAMLRRANDEYRKIIFNSQAYYNTGAGTLPQCVDMATKDFLASGINCVEYKNGARVGIDAYARMAIRTANTRAYLLGESSKRDEWGVSTVIVNKRGVACPKCLQYVGRVFYDDVWGSAPIPSPEKYPRLSEAISGGLYHPNCKDIHTTYFEGITTPPEPMTERQKKEAARVYNLEQQQRYNERQIRKYKRLSDGSVDPENQHRYQNKLEEWQDVQKKFVKANGDVLKRRYENESIHGIGPIDNADTRKAVEDMRREVALERQRLSKNSEKILTNSSKSDIMQSGAKSGALTSKNDPDSVKREAFAEGYYREVLGRKREYEIAAVAKNSGMSVEDIDKIFAHVFELEHLFDDGSIHKFIPDYDMAQSWIRLREGKNIQEHDRILLMHELTEANIMGTGTTIAYEPVHREVQKTYNYVAALLKYKKENDLM